MGTNYDGPTPTPQAPEVWRSPRYLATWARKRIGLATSQSVRGPWKRQPTPWLFRGQPAHVEDPFLWYEDGRVQALMKDMTGAGSGGPELLRADAETPRGDCERRLDPALRRDGIRLGDGNDEANRLLHRTMQNRWKHRTGGFGVDVPQHV